LVATAAFGLVVIQGLLGAVTVWRELPASIVTAHLGTAMLFFACTLLTVYYVAIDRGEPTWLVKAGRDPGLVEDRTFSLYALAAAAVIFLLILTGGMTSTTGAALACDEWPRCISGQIIPDHTSRYTWYNLTHRFTALLSAVGVAIVLYQAQRRTVSKAARRLAIVAAAIIAFQILVGAGYVLMDGNAWMSAGHLGTAAALWAIMLGISVVARRPSEAERSPAGWRVSPLRPAGAAEALVQMSAQPPPTGGSALQLHGSGGGAGAALAPGAPGFSINAPDLQRLRAMIADYVALTKPGILTLLIATTLGGMLAGAAGLPPLGLIIATIIGGLLAAGGANTLNCYIDRDIDAQMHRTRHRGTASGRISPRSALIFGLAQSVISFFWFGLLVNWLAAILAMIGNIYYVLVYTKWLKRRTPQNIVIGGAAGAMPPMVGWAAATGELSVAAFLLFAIIYYWTPPHFWALALLKQGEYGRAEVPMLPVVAGEDETRRQILLYTILMTAVSLMLTAFGFGWIYLLSAAALNGIFLALAILLARRPNKRYARQTFFYSLWYLALIFVAMVADRLILA
jgi:protoheme IX farnesyltransferase